MGSVKCKHRLASSWQSRNAAYFPAKSALRHGPALTCDKDVTIFDAAAGVSTTAHASSPHAFLAARRR
jgi:hypothetical protein